MAAKEEVGPQLFKADGRNPLFAGKNISQLKAEGYRFHSGSFPWPPVVQYPKPGEPVTQEQLKALLLDSKFFRERFFWIIDMEGRRVPYIQNDAQANYYINKTTHDLILKSRKLGFSSEVEGDFLFDCMTRPNISAVTMAQSEDDMKVHQQRIKFYLDTCGAAGIKFDVKIGKMNETEIHFPAMNSYYWTGTAGSRGWGRGRTVNRFHGTEVAHWEDQAVLTAVLEAIPPGPHSRRVLETTANGVGERFHEMWWEASDPNSGSPWKPHFWAWWQHPLYIVSDDEMPERMEFTEYERMLMERFSLNANRIQWLRNKTAEMADKSLRPQEYPSTPEEAFIASGRPAFNIERIDQMRSTAKTPSMVCDLYDDGLRVEPRESTDGLFTVWIPPRPTNKYLVAADIALGVRGGAFSVGTVFDRSSWEVVAEWRGRIEPAKFGNELVNIAIFYNKALLAPELNNHGQATITRIEDLGYPHMLKTTDLFEDATEQFGVLTNGKTKKLFISALRNAIDDRSYKENSIPALTELRSAVFDSHNEMVSNMHRDKNDEEKGAHLDCVMARAIGLYVLAHLTKDETYRNLNEGGGQVVTPIVPRGGGYGRRY